MMRERAATPPTTPPAMAATGVGVDTGDGVGVVVTVVVARPVVADVAVPEVAVGAVIMAVRREVEEVEVGKMKGL
jgi:hypothetical protein